MVNAFLCIFSSKNTEAKLKLYKIHSQLLVFVVSSVTFKFGFVQRLNFRAFSFSMAPSIGFVYVLERSIPYIFSFKVHSFFSSNGNNLFLFFSPSRTPYFSDLFLCIRLCGAMITRKVSVKKRSKHLKIRISNSLRNLDESSS